MMTFEYSPARRQILSETLERVLSKAHVTMIREILCAEKPGRPTPQAEDVYFWMRYNMPQASERVDELLHLAD